MQVSITLLHQVRGVGACAWRPPQTQEQSSHQGSLSQVDTHRFLPSASKPEGAFWMSPIQNEKRIQRSPVSLPPGILGGHVSPRAGKAVCIVQGGRKETGGSVGPSWRPPVQAGFYCVPSFSLQLLWEVGGLIQPSLVTLTLVSCEALGVNLFRLSFLSGKGGDGPGLPGWPGHPLSSATCELCDREGRNSSHKWEKNWCRWD